MLARIDGSGVLALRQWDGWLATWSPDGGTLAFQIADCPGTCVGFVTPLGQESSVRLLDAWGVVWRP
jgi:hypothetical protein